MKTERKGKTLYIEKINLHVLSEKYEHDLNPPKRREVCRATTL